MQILKAEKKNKRTVYVLGKSCEELLYKIAFKTEF